MPCTTSHVKVRGNRLVWSMPCLGHPPDIPNTITKCQKTSFCGKMIFCFPAVFACFDALYYRVLSMVKISDGNWRQVDQELGRYLNACQQDAKLCTNFSIAGPDGTKVGTGLSIFCGNVMFQATGRVAVMPPQVLWTSHPPTHPPTHSLNHPPTHRMDFEWFF